jgi:hypothetical protein
MNGALEGAGSFFQIFTSFPPRERQGNTESSIILYSCAMG